MHDLSTGCHAVSPRQDVDCADDIGVVLVAAFDAQKLRLRLAVLCRVIPTGRTRPAGILRRYGNKHSRVSGFGLATTPVLGAYQPLPLCTRAFDAPCRMLPKGFLCLARLFATP